MKIENFNEAKLNFEEGVKLFNNKNYEFAEKKFLNSLKLTPGRLSIISNLIKIYIETKQVQKLSNILKEYKNFENEKEILLGLAYNLYFNENFKESIKICNQIVNHKEIKYTVQDLLASNYKKNNDFLSALKVYRKQLLEKKNDYKIYYNIGSLFFVLGKINQAYYYFEKSKKIKPNHADISWRLSLCALALKDLKNGFLLYEDRWKRENHPQKKFDNIKLPNNILEIKDKKVLIWDEQGLGDALQFSRFVIDLKKYTNQITFVVNKKLKDILSNLSSDIFVVDYENLKDVNFDFQIPICSLPKLLNISKIEDINFYKLSLPETKYQYKDFKKNKLNVGLAWSGNPNYLMDKYRSISFNKFDKLLKLKNVDFYKLSKNVREDEFIDYHSYSNLSDFGDKSLFEISRILKELDLVVSSDTSIIHLAGILKINSILLLNFNADWRWFGSKKNTNWYPSIRIIKQNQFNSWDNVFEDLIIEVKKIYNNKFK